ncbi:hypothetical protein BT96DRAFT_972390 [Gymnopus androsaceus JB14]|uniref:Uncharacterized protein n=1 Tax=Gymnopus androsaceus JB14 TaxID=1447944 RepID=A0A6A4IAJ7_9AGAR|nr:hypothetical protein BT96DRAFT_972390 [Gymnopus androsaceus JB14]
MKLTISAPFIVLASAACLVQSAPAVVKRGDGSTAHVISTGHDGALIRYFVEFTGPDAQGAGCGSDFLAALRGAGGVTHNWQCYWNGNSWEWDDSEVAGPVGQDIINNAIAQVTS